MAGHREERSDNKILYQGYVAILALIPVVCGYIGTVKVGWTIGNDELSIISGFRPDPRSLSYGTFGEYFHPRQTDRLDRQDLRRRR